uniref:probable E3 ubiquitin-protein ligase ARI9 n=1 Tax=Erigeron canadensis TaxID=72917 RepID=UPI001CB8A947|nr:probable E3 ubiquitin-protein ligase ARI9 [Erigeron canadensis]
MNNIIQISDDEQYAEVLQLQEALTHSSLTEDESSLTLLTSSSSSSVMESTESKNNYCGICMDSKNASEIFKNTNICSHMYCTECIRSHVATKIKENNLTTVTCPDPNCKSIIGPEVCKDILPKQVLEKWEDGLCESLIMATEKFYCPFKDCSAILVNDGGSVVTSSECPVCNRLFCAQCRVAWHCGLDCNEYMSLNENERDPSDLMLMDLAKSNKWKRCPNCNYIVERTSGCPHISCRCGHHFCYQCGKECNGNGRHTCSQT